MLSSSFKYLSHKNKLLKEHLLEVAKLSRFQISKKRFCFKDLDGYNNIKKLITYCAIFHDFGKYSTKFQEKILKNKNIKVNHSLFSACVLYYVLKKLNFSKEDCLICFYVVKYHHTELDNLNIDNNKIVETIKNNRKYFNVKNIVKEYSIILRKLRIINKKIISGIEEFFEIEDFSNFLTIEEITSLYGYKNYFKFLVLYSLLCDSDKLLATGKKYWLIRKILIKINAPIRNNAVNKFIDNLKPKLEIDKHRRRAYLEANNNLDLSKKLFFLDLPTGLGKTLIGLSIASRLSNRHSKIIYCMPYTTIIDQNYSVVKKIFKNGISKDHYLSKDYKMNEKEISINEDVENLLIKNWHFKITVSTFVQLFEGVIVGSSKETMKIHNLINSVIILDEIQLIDPKKWNLCFFFIFLCMRYLNCKFIIMSATLPKKYFKNFRLNLKKDIFGINGPQDIISEEKLFRDFVKFNSQELIKNKKEYYVFNRYKINVNISEPFDKEKIYKLINKLEGTILIVLNTIKETQDIYTFLKNKGIKNIVCLNTKVVPKERMRRLENYKNKIIVSTQLIEAGVDIDVDYIIREFCNLDSLVQTSGRCNRHNSKGLSEIYLINIEEMKYSYKIYGVISIDNTKNMILNKKTIYEQELYSLLDEYYSSLEKIDENKEYDLFAEDRYYLNFENKFKLIDVISYPLLVLIDKSSKKLIIELENLKKKIKSERDYDKKFKLLRNIQKINEKLWEYSINLRYSELEENRDLFDENLKKFILRDPKHDERYDLEVGFKIIKNDDFSCI